MIKIDFHGSTHGHFLEYVSNVYIMQTSPSQCNIFKPPTYSAHNLDNQYLHNRQIISGHFSKPEYNLKIYNHDQIIRIKIDLDNDNMMFVALTNLICKAGDVGFEQQMLSIPDSIRNNKIEYRNNWYSKLNERNTYVHHYIDFLPITAPIFEFQFKSFFSFKDFCIELSALATFLNQTFFPNQSLYNLWFEFITRNQGWQSYLKCNQLLEDIFANRYADIECSIMEEGWLNYNLSKICRLYNGAMFEQEIYPKNTQQVYNIIQEHLIGS